MRSRLRGWLPWMVLAALGLGPLLVCALIGPVNLGGDLGLKAAPDWSRGLQVGTGFYGTDSGAPLVVDEQQRVHLVWAVRFSAAEHDLHYARLDDRGLVEEEHDLSLGLREPRKVRLSLDRDGRINIFLLALSGRGDPSSLFHVTLTGDGRVETAPTLVSSGDSPTNEYAVASGSDGIIHLFWTEGLDAGRKLLHAALAPGLGVTASPRLLATGVSTPVATATRDGRIHLLWEQPGVDEETAELYYQVFTDELPSSLSGSRLLDLPSGSRVSRAGPVLALDQEYAYLVWTVEYRVARMAPTALESWYASFALDSPSVVDARSFSLPMVERPTYVGHDSPYNLEYLVPSEGETEFGSNRVADPSPLGAQDEAVVTLGMIVMRGLGRESQIANTVFGGGRLIGYQLACNTTHWSRLSNLGSDSSGNLHLSWVDGLEPGPSAIYYASTSSSVRERVDHLTGDDLLLAVLNTAFSAAVGVTMIPFVVLWIVPSLVWVLISGFFLGDRGVRSPGGYVALGIALLIYQLGKVYFTPALLDYVPFSLTVSFLPDYLHLPLQVLVPVGIAALGATGVGYTLLRVETRSLLVAWLVFILVDALLTMVVYGPGMRIMG